MAKEDENKKTQESYSAKDISVLEGLEPVRKRPGMYIGSTGLDGLHHLIWEVVDNSLDEAMAGYCKNIDVELLPDNHVKITDDGRGIPVDIHPQTKKSALETVLTTLHAGAKFGSKAYQVSGGLHGVGVSVVCALSTWSKAEVCRDGGLYMQEYDRGKPRAAVKKVGKCEGHGTIISFDPDPQIFKEIEFEPKRIITHLRQQAYLTKGIKINIVNKSIVPATSYSFYFEGGLYAYVKYMTRGKNAIHQNVFYVAGERNEVQVEAAFIYTDEFEGMEQSFANNIVTVEGGTHLTGFRTAMTRIFNDYVRKNNILKATEDNLTGEDLREGLTVVVSIKIRDPQFEGQTKGKLGNPEAKNAVEGVVAEALTDFLERNPSDARSIVEKCILSHKARKAAKAARETVLRKGILDGLSLPGKLADCTSRAAEDAEIYIVEGESAGGSAKQARNRRFQAILPLRGKILNVERTRLDKMLESKEVKALVIALGTAIAEDFNIEKLRYQHIVIMADADSDGNHIRTLLLTLFYRYFKPIIERGYVYIAQPPLYKMTASKEIRYAYTEDEKNDILKTFTKPGLSIQRYKGLGEMNAEELWETTMNPRNRILLQVKIDDAIEADAVFDMLMGDEVAPRKKFIQTCAKNVKNLDV